MSALTSNGNYYAILGVLPDSDTDEIKASYRQLVKRLHPDMRTGSARLFYRIQEAYDVLSHPEQRSAYDKAWHAAAGNRAARNRTGGTGAGGSGAAQGEGKRWGSKAKAAPKTGVPVNMLTRIMSITVPRSGRFQLQGLIGNIHIQPTTPDNLWDTTLRKYGDAKREHLARHVIQIKLSGERDLVRSMMPRPTDFGVEFQQASERERKNRLHAFIDNLMGSSPFGSLFTRRPFGLYGAFLPLTLHVTVPVGTALFLRDVTGAIDLGDTEGEVTAKLLGGVLKTGRISRAHLTLNGSSRAFLSDLHGPLDMMGFGKSRTYVAGRISRVRAVLDNEAELELACPVESLLAEAAGHSQLFAKEPVRDAYCDLKDYASAHLELVLSSLDGTRAPTARIHARGPKPAVSVA